LYEDDGISQEYLKPRGTWTRTSWNDGSKRLMVEPGEFLLADAVCFIPVQFKQPNPAQRAIRTDTFHDVPNRPRVHRERERVPLIVSTPTAPRDFLADSRRPDSFLHPSQPVPQSVVRS
jgi:hypothetical protein